MEVSRPAYWEVKYVGQYVYFTEEQKLRADSIDLEDFLRQQGETLIRSGHELRLKSDHSVTIRGNEWFDHATQNGGHPVSFVQRHYGLSFPEAMSMLLGGEHGRSYRARDAVIEERKPCSTIIVCTRIQSFMNMIHAV